MGLRVKFPIRTKLLVLIGMLVMIAIAAYLTMAVTLFKEDKTSLVYELNVSNVRTLSSEIAAELGKISDKIQLLTQGHQSPSWVRAIFDAEPSLIAYSLYRPSGQTWKSIASHRNPEYLKLYQASSKAIDDIRREIPIPFSEVLKRKTLVWNSTLAKGAPVLSLAMVLQIRNQSTPLIAVADLRLDQILSLFGNRGISTVYLVDSFGKVVAHPDRTLVEERASLQDNPIVTEALTSSVGLKMTRFSWDQKKWIGAFSQVGIGGLQTVSQIPESEVSRASWRLVQKSIVLALTLITLSLFLTTWISKTFTEPVYSLLRATEKISQGQFGESIRVKTNDEIANLASAFNTMSQDLKVQREQIEAHQAELEQKIKERTAELEMQKKKLAESQETLLRTTRLASLGELAGVAAHEVLNPVNNIHVRLQRMHNLLNEKEVADYKLLGEILEGWEKAYKEGGWKKLSEELQKNVDSQKTLLEEDLENLQGIAKDTQKRFSEKEGDFDFLTQEVHRITRIVNNMRSLARVQSERKPISIQEPIEDTLVTLTDLFEKNHIQLEKNLQDQGQLVLADKDELVQVFSNVLLNALQALTEKSTPHGKVRIDTSVSEKRLEIRISDNGPGIPKQFLGRIFEPDFTTKSLGQGTGLGLSISRRLIRAFDGDIEVEKTEEGKGTTFLIWLPLSQKTAPSTK